ncbi:hypothetical protein B0H19DRAFT_1065541 [Mycena capillaripes]|nr:hypothetical protein B0H19DRAFT_1065541 [Mycena capillaripes]
MHQAGQDNHCIQGAPRLRPTQTYTQFAKDCVGPGKLGLGVTQAPRHTQTCLDSATPSTYAILGKLSVERDVIFGNRNRILVEGLDRYCLGIWKACFYGCQEEPRPVNERRFHLA